MQQLNAWVSQYGVLLVFANVLVVQLGIPIPAMPTLIVAGALAARGGLSAPAVLLAALLASLIADMAWYLLGRRYGLRVLKTLCRVSLSPDSCVRQTEGIFERWGMGALVLSKFITGFATIAPPLVGAMGVRPLTFVLYASLGALLWAGVGVGLGLLFHRAVEGVLAFLEGLGTFAFILVGSALLLLVVFKWWQRRRFYRTLRMARMSVEELRARMDAKQAPLVVDVRTESARRTDPRRIPGATTMAFSEIGEKLAGLPFEREVILYCT